jgi:probable rRNA maturation factor
MNGKIILEINKQTYFKKFPNFDKILEFCIETTLLQGNFGKFSKKIKKISVSLLICNAEEILRLNNTFRNKNYVTNVLSFEDGDEFDGVLNIGDIAMCVEKIKEEAKISKKTFKTHFIHLFCHGVLHLIGFDHETPYEQTEMEAIEDKIMEIIAREFTK